MCILCVKLDKFLKFYDYTKMQSEESLLTLHGRGESRKIKIVL